MGEQRRDISKAAVMTNNGMDILSVMSLDELNEIQNTIANVTGLAFVTVDYKGDVVSEPTSFTNFCRTVREDMSGNLLCRLSDASGAILAAANQTVSIYQCPCGLVDIAIPIIIEGKYLGGFIGGQIMCIDPPESLVRFSKNMASNAMPSKWDIHNTDVSLDDVRRYTYDEIVCIADLVELIVTKILSQRIVGLEEQEKGKEHIQELEKQLRSLKLENRLMKDKYYDLKRTMGVLFDRQIFNIMANMAIVEGAVKTNNTVLTYLDMMGNQPGGGKNTVDDELRRTELFVKLNRISYGERLQYECVSDPATLNHSMPFMLLMPFICAAVHYFFNVEVGTLELKLTTAIEQDKIVVRIWGNNLRLSSSEYEYIYATPANSINEDMRENDWVNETERQRVVYALIALKRTLAARFGEAGKMEVKRISESGMDLQISYPIRYGEVR